MNVPDHISLASLKDTLLSFSDQPHDDDSYHETEVRIRIPYPIKKGQQMIILGSVVAVRNTFGGTFGLNFRIENLPYRVDGCNVIADFTLIIPKADVKCKIGPAMVLLEGFSTSQKINIVDFEKKFKKAISDDWNSG